MLNEESVKDGENLFRKECTFVLGVADLVQLPENNMTEVAFAGRSNVGKSSLLNALVNAPIARASATPGRTQQMNFFCLNNEIYLVDLPGYGYAKAPAKEVKRWNIALMSYLKGRPSLRRVFLLIDSRHGIMDKDEEMMKDLDKAAVVFQIVLTKADKTNTSSLEKIIDETKKKMTAYTTCYPELILTSSEKKTGLDQLRATIFEINNH